MIKKMSFVLVGFLCFSRAYSAILPDAEKLITQFRGLESNIHEGISGYSATVEEIKKEQWELHYKKIYEPFVSKAGETIQATWVVKFLKSLLDQHDKFGLSSYEHTYVSLADRETSYFDALFDIIFQNESFENEKAQAKKLWETKLKANCCTLL